MEKITDKEIQKAIQVLKDKGVTLEMLEKYYDLLGTQTKMERRIQNGVIVTEKSTGRKLQVIDAIKTNNQFGYGVYLYRFVGESENFGLYRNEIEPNGW